MHVPLSCRGKLVPTKKDYPTLPKGTDPLSPLLHLLPAVERENPRPELKLATITVGLLDALHLAVI